MFINFKRQKRPKNIESHSFAYIFDLLYFLQGTELYQFSSRLSALTSRLSCQLSPNLPVKEKCVKDAETVKTEIETLFNQLQQHEEQQQEQHDITTSLQKLSLAIEKRRRSESNMMTVNGNNGTVNGNENKIHAQQNGQNALQDDFDRLEKMLGNLISQKHQQMQE